MNIKRFVQLAIEEDIKKGDHSALACIPGNAIGRAQLLVKENGIIAGVQIAKAIFKEFNPEFQFKNFIDDGNSVKKEDVVFEVTGSSRILLSAERLVLNVMQRMSAIATLTAKFNTKLNGLNTKILDTRKTSPLIRFLEKEAVRLGGGHNHRMGLYDMIMIKDNHIDFAGGIKQSILKANQYLKDNDIDLKIEIETRNLKEVREVLKIGKVNRIMLDNFSLIDLKSAVKIINKKYETEASGGITLDTVRSYAECGVDYVSVGALTHSVKNMDLSLKAI